MRIVGGIFGGRRFSPPARIPARPTTEVAKEGLFNMLNNSMDLEGIKTLDLFGGTGSISYELASRGAGHLTIVERDPVTVDFIKKTIQELGIKDKMDLIRNDVFKFMKQNTEKYDLIFAGPPYALDTIDDLPKLVFDLQMLLPGGTFVLEHTPRNDYQNHPRFARIKNYGTTVFTFFTRPDE
ncbi:16S rRNA (guanine(966)-N(2))-methyltransferase RsmD [Nemorincola caseinilytica]|uniref:16S rRNA (Guanine(966)-N(2))-methyltransferase RsmD n=1 Tax=Nemorincola caseinilytica TaxID=2054315 RepID=A0ABP8NQQ9_9BACT